MVTGGDVLVEIRTPAGVSSNALRVTVDGRDVREVFSSRDGGDTLVGLVGGLAIGSNLLEARMARHTASLELVNHPITGPVFSGPHQQPFVCETVESGLGPSDENCHVDGPEVRFFARSGGGWTPIEDPSDPPPGVPTTTTLDGETVPYIVRVESGTINRAVYRIAMLDDGTYDATGEPGPGWNRKLVYNFGGGCDAGFHQGVTAPEDVLFQAFLGRGFAVATSSLNVGATNCNDTLSAETMMMVKEHIAETYGLPRYTVGQGGSGGAIQVHLIGENYPGLLDGILPGAAFPDAFSIGSGITDCRLLNTYFERSTLPWTEPQRAAVTGFALNPIPVCESIDRAFGDSIDADDGCRIPQALVYDPETNPDGARCTVQDHLVNVFGSDPDTGFARRPLDNVGVQYGLVALNDGRITIEQFLDLNAQVGGYDIDGNLVPQRTVGNLDAVHTAYSTGRVVSGAGGLHGIPIITIAAYKDHLANPHDRFRNFSLRHRLEREHGEALNHVIWTTPGMVPGTKIDVPVVVMDRWLENILADPAPDDGYEKVVRNRPDEAQDACWINGRYDERQRYDEGVCATTYHAHGDPRIAAGAPVADDVLKCQLKPIDPADYAVPLTPLHLDRLHEVFPDGVCDNSLPGIGQGTFAGTWQTFGN